METYYVYMVCNKCYTTVYIGVTNDLERRIYEDRNKANKSFTSKYNCDRLVWYEDHHDIHVAISREKQLKNWKRDWKNKLIQEENPEWNDLAEDWFDGDTGAGPA